jgi:N-acetylglucosamine transport system substrate-binding protein
MFRSKLVLTVGAAALALSALAGCGGGGNSGANGANGASGGGSAPTAENAQTSGSAGTGGPQFADKELDVAVFQGGYGREYWDTLAEDFMKDYPGTKINITASPKIADIVRPKIVAGNPPDLMYISGSDNTPILDGLIKDKALLDLTDVFNQDEGSGALKDKILPGVLETRSMSP